MVGTAFVADHRGVCSLVGFLFVFVRMGGSWTDMRVSLHCTSISSWRKADKRIKNMDLLIGLVIGLWLLVIVQGNPRFLVDILIIRSTLPTRDFDPCMFCFQEKQHPGRDCFLVNCIRPLILGRLYGIYGVYGKGAVSLRILKLKPLSLACFITSNGSYLLDMWWIVGITKEISC